MTEKIECEFFLAIDENGDWQIAKEADDASDGLVGSIRMVTLTAKITPPVLEQTTIDIPETAGTTEQIEVEAA